VKAVAVSAAAVQQQQQLAESGAESEPALLLEPLWVPVGTRIALVLEQGLHIVLEVAEQIAYAAELDLHIVPEKQQRQLLTAALGSRRARQRQ
jgi:hypothetical protein